MRILVISHMFPNEKNPALGGFVADQAAAIHASGRHSVAVVTCQFVSFSRRYPISTLLALFRVLLKPRFEHSVSPSGLVCFRFYCPSPGWGPGVLSYLYEWWFLRAVSRIQEQFPFDIIHAHTSLFDGSAARAAAERLKIPYYITEHTGPFSLLLRGPLSKYRTGQALARARAIFPVSRYLAQCMIEAFPSIASRVRVIPNTLDLHVFRPLAQTSERARGLKIGWLGHFQPVKRVDLLLEAFAQFHSRSPDATLSLIGKGDKERDIRKWIDERGLGAHIAIRRANNKQEVSKLLNELDVLIVSSDVETFSMAAVEALACGVYVISTDCGGPRDIVTQPHLGCIVKGSVAGILRALEEVNISSQNERTARHEFVVSHFGAERVVSQYEEAFEFSVVSTGQALNKS